MASTLSPEPWRSNLVDRSAPDKPGETQATTVRLKTEDLEWLRQLPHGVSYHVRQAIHVYRETLNDGGD